MKITLQPLGKVDITIVNVLNDKLALLFGCPVMFSTPIGVSQDAFYPERNQYLSDGLIKSIKNPDKDSHEIILAVADVDIFTRDKDFIFGQADMESGKGIISLYRLRQNADNDLFTGRMVKEAVHELGHILGLNHCRDSTCIMNFSHSLHDTDNKAITFCNKCQPKLLK